MNVGYEHTASAAGLPTALTGLDARLPPLRVEKFDLHA